MGGSRSRDVQNLACGSGVGGSRSRDVQNLAYGSGVGGSRSRDVQNLACGSGVGGSRSKCVTMLEVSYSTLCCQIWGCCNSIYCTCIGYLNLRCRTKAAMLRYRP